MPGVAEHVGGVVLALLGASGDSLGCTLQKLSHDQEALAVAETGRAETFYLSRPSWWKGFAVFVIGALFSFAALAFIGQATAILLGAWGLCVNLYTAPAILHESRSWRDVGAVGVMVVGIGLSVGSAKPNDQKWTRERLLHRFGDLDVAVFLTVLLGLIVITFTTTRLYTRSLRRRWETALGASSDPHPDPAATTPAASGSGQSGVRADGEAREEGGVSGGDDGGGGRASESEHGGIPMGLRLQHVLLASLVATVTVTFGKATSELLSDRASGHRAFEGWSFMIPLVLLISLPSQLHFINTSLQVNDALFHIPIFYVFWVVGGSIAGGIFYEEFNGYVWWRWLLLIAGIAVVFGGVAMAAARLAMLHVAMAAEPSAPVVVNKAFTDEPTNGTSTLEEPLLPADDTSMAE
eukprot:m.116246 g.116246  ORF g.116246 m.116246 type:complete len:409 (-) comp13127_c0_seq2:81-1307(-)